MKLPFEFGTKLIFRLVFPGLIVAIAMFPVINGALLAAQIDLKAEYLFPIEIVTCGWLVVVSDMRIYMLFEGRRYWPSTLRRWMLASEKRRLETLRPVVFGGTNTSDESAVDYAQFPVDVDGVSYVEYPSRLGNLIESFENYPLVKYGLDSVFYWNRLWVSLDKDLREELDNAQAVVDSTLYVTFALYTAAFLGIGYAVGEQIANSHWYSAHGWPVLRIPELPSLGTLYVVAGLCLLAGFILYRLSLPLHAQFGELFKSVFDQFRQKLQFDDVLEQVGQLLPAGSVDQKTPSEKNHIIFRFLRWHVIRDEISGTNYPVGEWRKRIQTATSNNRPPP